MWKGGGGLGWPLAVRVSDSSRDDSQIYESFRDECDSLRPRAWTCEVEVGILVISGLYEIDTDCILGEECIIPSGGSGATRDSTLAR